MSCHFWTRFQGYVVRILSLAYVATHKFSRCRCFRYTYFLGTYAPSREANACQDKSTFSVDRCSYRLVLAGLVYIAEWLRRRLRADYFGDLAPWYMSKDIEIHARKTYSAMVVTTLDYTVWCLSSHHLFFHNDTLLLSPLSASAPLHMRRTKALPPICSVGVSDIYTHFQANLGYTHRYIIGNH